MQTEDKLPFEQYSRKILIKKDSAIDSKYGKAPEKIPNPKDFKADGVGAISQDKKKKLGEM